MSSLPDLRLFAGLFVALVLTLASHAAPPVVSNVHASQAGASQPVKIFYDLQDADSATVRVSLLVSEDGGGTWNVPAQSLSGFGFGDSVTPGSDRYILWNAPADWPGHQSNLVRFRVVVNDDPIPSGMVQIGAGNFQMGNALSASGDGDTYELPLHTVFVSAFYMDRYEVTKQLWDDVRASGQGNGYTDLPVGSFSGSTNYSKGPTHPVHLVSWYAMVKWCNARSQKEGLTPCYYTSDAQTPATIYKTGDVNVTNAQVKWGANGYRLPTEAEWEKAARGGASGHRFPWANVETITHAQANYYVYSSNGTTNYYSYDVSATRGYDPTYAVGGTPNTSPVGSFAPNGYGLYDMAGNVWEWCWDCYGAYSSPASTDPQGPPPGSYRMIRGGSWGSHAVRCRTASRNDGPPGNTYDSIGFRTVRR